MIEYITVEEAAERWPSGESFFAPERLSDVNRGSYAITFVSAEDHALDALGQRLRDFLAADEASVDTMEEYVASVLTTRANLAYAPGSTGGAPFFFTPSWVRAFERNVPGWKYEAQIFAFGGVLFLAGETGAKLAALFLTLSRQERGGRLDHDERRDLYRFTPDKDAKAWRWALTPTKRKRIVRPNEQPKGQALILPGGAA